MENFEQELLEIILKEDDDKSMLTKINLLMNAKIGEAVAKAQRNCHQNMTAKIEPVIRELESAIIKLRQST